MSTEVLQGSIVLSDRLVGDGQIVIEDGAISAVLTEGDRHVPTVDYGNAFILPGFIDVHVHGIAGEDVMGCSPESLAHMAQVFARHGVTGFFPTTVTADLEHTMHTIDCIVAFMADQPPDCARVLGIHLEGPFMALEFKGMQNERHLLPPDPEALRSLLEHGRGRVTRVSLAPELPGAEELITMLRSEGIDVSIAHTGATYEEVMTAVERGARHVTHCFNAMRGLHHREPGVAGAALLCDDLYTELIADGIHIHPAVMRLLIRQKGRERVLLVTDSMQAADMPEGEYTFGGHDVTVRSGIARLADGTLASSTLTMDGAVRNVVRLCGASLVDAAYMAATAPAESTGIGTTTGRIAPGYCADLAVLDPELQPVATWVRGEPAFRQETA